MKSPIFVAELTINHLGMVNIAKVMIKAAKEAGAHFVKLKKKNVKKYYKKDVRDWRHFKFLDYRESLELSHEDFAELDAYCKELGIGWYSSVHDDESLDFVKEFDVPMYKVASMDSSKEALVDRVIQVCREEGKPLVLSLGGKSAQFAKNQIEKVRDAGVKAYILHTVSIYPTPVSRCNINYVKDLVEEYEDENIRIGYSGHEEGIGPSILAATYGASMVERHFTLSKDYQIHHIGAAITPIEFKRMTDIIKDTLAEQQSECRAMDQEELKFLEEIEYV